MQKKPKYKCICGDAEMYFKFNREYSPEEVAAIFSERISGYIKNILPGLILENEEGVQFKAILKLVLEQEKNANGT